MDNLLQHENEEHYHNLNKKLDSLQSKQNRKTTHSNNQQNTKFHHRTVNLTDIKFTREETLVLEKGMQHIIQKHLDSYWSNLVMETEQAIKLLEPKQQDGFHTMATTKLKQIYNSSNNHNQTAHKRQTYIARCINKKLTKERAMVVKADKGKTMVIIKTNEYTKCSNFSQKTTTKNSSKTQPNKTTNNYQRLCANVTK
jgi:hypothetical protein